METKNSEKRTGLFMCVAAVVADCWVPAGGKPSGCYFSRKPG